MSLLDTASLIVTPNAYKEGKLYSVIPSDGSGDLSVTRATDATRVNSAGLVELVPYNLFTNTTTFSAWVENGFISDGHADPFGGNNARLYEFDNNLDRIALSRSITAGVTYTLSAWIKGVNLTDFRMLLGTNQMVDVYPQIVNGEWVRVSATVTATTTGNYQQSPARADSSNVQSFYIYGPQLVEGTEAKDYLPTETRLNIPRIDYSLGSCPSILVEPQRTNLVTYSEQFDNAAWTKSNTTKLANNAISPSGLSNADKLYPSTSGTLRRCFESITVTNATVYTSSAYIKADGKNWVLFTGVSNAANTFVYFDLANGVVGTVGAAATASITSVGNGWYRCIVTSTSTSTAGYSYFAVVDGDNTTSVTANGTDGVLVWGAQLEAGAYATSYIPTTSASVTRNADVISKTGISSLIGQTEGTIFVEFISTALQSYTQRIINLSDGTTSNAIGVQLASTNQLIFYVENGGSNQVVITKTSPAITLGSSVKIAAAYKANDFVFYVNGVQVGTDTSGSVPATSQLKFTEANGTNPYIGNVKAVSLWKERLTNDQLTALTTL